MATVFVPETPASAPVYRITINEDKKEIGHVYIYIIGDISKQGKKYALLDHMAVDDAYRDKGYGKENCYKIVLYSRKENHNAHAFYIKRGFVFWGFEFRKSLEDNAAN
jgi:GNAT superfamily N-acetyltransferase